MCNVEVPKCEFRFESEITCLRTLSHTLLKVILKVIRLLEYATILRVMDTLNMRVVNQLREDLGPVFSTMVKKMLDNLSNELGSISEVVNDHDADGLRKTSHSLKGSISNFGAEKMTAQCLLLEKMGQEGKIETAKKELNILRKMSEEFSEQLSELIEE